MARKSASNPAAMPADTLRVCEIFASIQGESVYAGRPCVLVRTVGCNLRCSYCDSKYAYSGGEVMTLSEILAMVEGLRIPLVEVTGGEPLLHAGVYPLMSQLADRSFVVLLETSGSVDISSVDPRVTRIVDFKTPSSGSAEANLWTNLSCLRKSDEVKVVIGDRVDYDWAKERLSLDSLGGTCHVSLSPVYGRLAPELLAAWILQDRLPVRLQLQLHKLLWGPHARGV